MSSPRGGDGTGTLRIGVVGLGRIGAEHAAVVAGHPRVGEVVVADAVRSRADDVATRVGGRAADLDDLDDAALDGLIIATATATHADLIERFLPLGVPILCEKPIALDLAGTTRIVEQVRARGAAVTVGFHRRFDAGYHRARAALRSGELGELRRAHLLTCDSTPPPAEFIRASGGIVKDCLIHDIDILRWLTGQEIETVHATGVNRGAAYIGEAGDVDEAAALLTLTDGTIATAHTSRYNGAGHDVRAELAGTGGTIAVGLDDRMPLRSAEPGASDPPPGPPWQNFWERFLPAYRAELGAFVDLVAAERDDAGPQAGTADAATPEDALAALRVAEAAMLSMAEHRPVAVREVGSAPA